MSERLFVIIASVGRAALLRQTLGHLARQTRRPDGVVVVGAESGDVTGLEAVDDLSLEVIFADRGLPIQRNAGLRHVRDRADLIVFFDDDFVPAPDYLAELESLFVTRPEVVGATGRLIADGIKSPGLSFADGLALIAADARPANGWEREMPALYGCNLSVRVSAAAGIWFDESLPLYGWQEDVDFSYQLGKRGTLLLTSRLNGVHLGAKAGRTSGKKLGYSQIANPVYLLQKKTIPRKLAWKLMIRNVSANFIGAFRPESYVDRPGRVYGNLLALRDLITGRLHPTRILGL